MGSGRITRCTSCAWLHQTLLPHRPQQSPQKQPGDYERQQQVGDIPERDLHTKWKPSQMDMQKVELLPKLRHSP
jgi:hypothetical protein